MEKNIETTTAEQEKSSLKKDKNIEQMATIL
jgi:hypothetical protein